MRISDWSSDVCSSDLFLRELAIRFLDVGLARPARHPQRRIWIGHLLLGAAYVRANIGAHSPERKGISRRRGGGPRLPSAAPARSGAAHRPHPPPQPPAAPHRTRPVTSRAPSAANS